MSPPYEERRPPGGEDGAHQIAATARQLDDDSVAVAADNDEDSDRQVAIDFSIAADLAVMDAENSVARLGRAVEAMRALTTPALRSLQWIGIVDDVWPLMITELERRGEAL